MSDSSTRKIVPLKPRREELCAKIARIARADRLVYLGTHARERMEERSITRQDAIRVLRIGEIEGEIERGQKPREWKCKVIGKVKGSREIGVVTVVASGESIFIITVEWEDL